MPFGPSVRTRRAHRLGHGEDEFQAFRRGDEGQRNAGVAARRFDEYGARVDLPRLQGVSDHREADAVFDAGERVEELEFEDDVREGAVRGRRAVEAHERSVADGIGDVVVDFGHGGRMVEV